MTPHFGSSNPAAPATGITGSTRWKTLVRILLTIALFVLLFWQVRWSDLWHAVQGLQGREFVWALLMWFPTQYLQFIRWDMLAREAGPDVSRGDIHRGYWVGFTLGLITPGRVGQVGRALALHNCPLSRAVGLSAMERAYSAVAMNGLGLLSLVFLPRLGWNSPLAYANPVLDVALLVTGIGLLLLGVFPNILHRPLTKIASYFPLREKVGRALEALQIAGPGRSALYLSLAIAAMASALIQFVLLVQALGGRVPLLAGMLSALLTFFIKGAIPISIGSLGVGEWTAMYCFRGLGVEASVAVAASLILFVLNVFIPSLIGFPFMSRLRVPDMLKPKAQPS